MAGSAQTDQTSRPRPMPPSRSVPQPVCLALGFVGLTIALVMTAGLIPTVFPEYLFPSLNDAVPSGSANQAQMVQLAAIVGCLLVAAGLLAVAWCVMRGAAWARIVCTAVMVTLAGLALQGLVRDEPQLIRVVHTVMALTSGSVVVLLWVPQSHRHFAT